MPENDKPVEPRETLDKLKNEVHNAEIYYQMVLVRHGQKAPKTQVALGLLMIKIKALNSYLKK